MNAGAAFTMTATVPDNFRDTNMQWRAHQVIHKGASGTWYRESPGSSCGHRTLPTEFGSASTGPTLRRILVARQPATREIMQDAVTGVTHRHLVGVTNVQSMTDNSGCRLFVQISASEPKTAASEIGPDQLANEWQQMVAAVASALAHFHAMGLGHGAVCLDNIFLRDQIWQLGPSLCSQNVFPADDLQALAYLIGTELRRLIPDHRQHPLLERLGQLCTAHGVAAAHIALWAECGVPETAASVPMQTPPAPRVERTSEGIVISVPTTQAFALLSCSPDRVPLAGSLVPATQVDQLGTPLPMYSPSEAKMPRPTETQCVFCVVALEGVALVGMHALVEPTRGWGDLFVSWRPEGVALQWFWPSDISSRKMRIQVRPDRYPRPQRDQATLECDRNVYAKAGRYVMHVPRQWTSVHVRLSRAEKPIDSTADAVFASAARNYPSSNAGKVAGRAFPVVLARTLHA